MSKKKKKREDAKKLTYRILFQVAVRRIHVSRGEKNARERKEKERDGGGVGNPKQSGLAVEHFRPCRGFTLADPSSL